MLKKTERWLGVARRFLALLRAAHRQGQIKNVRTLRRVLRWAAWWTAWGDHPDLVLLDERNRPVRLTAQQRRNGIQNRPSAP